MHFAKLRLSGFKSFVDPTELVIAPGLTGVVGPNGCGKSNLLEAIRWVMGENRAKSLRGKGMEDVIFAGSDRRPARHMAEVALVLDNLLRDAPALYNDSDQVEVMRRIERDAGSAYRINGNDVRQKDVQLLFADAATGAHSPALVSQGRIGALINAKPQDRRQVLEEAAGISGLHSRRKEAEQRLRGAETNLIRLQDVVQGMENQLASLKRQARHAVRYKDISRDIEKAEASLMVLRWRMAADAVQDCERALKAASAAVAEKAEAVAKITALQLEAQEKIPALRTAEADIAARIQAATIELNRVRAERERRATLVEALKARLENLDAEEEREADIRADAVAALDRLKTEEERLAAQEKEAEEGGAAARDALEATSAAASEAEQAYDTLNEQLLGVRARRASLESDARALSRRRDQLKGDMDRNAREAEALERMNGLEGGVAEAEAQDKAAEASRAKAEAKLDAAETALTGADQGASEARAVRSEAAATLKTLMGEYRTLERLVEGGRKTAKAPLLGQIEVEEGFEKAFGAALGGDVEAGTDEEEKRYWMDLADLPAASWPEGALPLSDYVTAPAALARRLGMTAVVEDVDTAKRLQPGLAPGQMLVSRDGGLWRWDGFVDAGAAASGAAQQLERTNRLKGLEASKRAAEKAMEAADAAMAVAIDAVAAAKTERDGARQTLDVAARACNEARRQVMKAQEEASRRASRLASVQDTLERLETENKDAVQRLSGLEAKLSELPESDQLESELGALRQRVEAARSVLGQARAAHDSLRREQEGRRDRLKAIAHEREAWTVRENRAASQITALKDRRAVTVQEKEAAEHRPEDEDAREVALVDAVSLAEGERRDAAEALAQAEAALKDRDQAVRSTESEHSQAREAEIRAEAALESGAEKRKSIARQIGERFGTDPTGALEKVGLEPDAALPAETVLEGKLDGLKTERDRLGSVNLRADEEMTEIETQLGHLVGERSDLETAIQRLRGAIGSLNREGRERLLAAFEVVNGHFSTLFTTLFGGGAAYLELTESDDPLEAGLEIFASPPGKKMQSLSLLSGGEQALTATSLIFAVFMTNPAPICVLDEVDAPLDDANVERFCNLLDEMIDRTDTRFLIVTHNAVTMSRMNRLFGVTMAERGVSTLVSVDLERAEELTEGL